MKRLGLLCALLIALSGVAHATTSTITIGHSGQTCSASTCTVTSGLVNANASARSVTINLPAASGSNIPVAICRTDATLSNSVTVVPNGSDTINGAANYPLNVPNQCVELRDIASASWQVVNRYSVPLVFSAQTLSGTGTQSVNWSTTSYAKWTLTGASTVGFTSSTGSIGQIAVVEITQGGSPQTLAWASAYVFPVGTPPAPPANTTWEYVFVAADATHYEYIGGTADTVSEWTPLSATGALGSFTSSAGNTTYQSCTVVSQAGHFTNLELTTDLDGSTCTTAPTYNVRDDTAATLGTAKAGSTSAGRVSQAESLQFSAGDTICLVRTVNGATCTGVSFNVVAEVVGGN